MPIYVLSIATWVALEILLLGVCKYKTSLAVVGNCKNKSQKKTLLVICSLSVIKLINVVSFLPYRGRNNAKGPSTAVSFLVPQFETDFLNLFTFKFTFMDLYLFKLTVFSAKQWFCHVSLRWPSVEFMQI